MFRENIREVKTLDAESETVQYAADVYELPISYTKNITERFEQNREQWREIAMEADKTETAQKVREIRNKLLDATDSEMSLDRVIKNAPETVADTEDATQMLESLAETLTGDMAKYRQALRDVPQQEGFPYHVQWPESPNK